MSTRRAALSALVPLLLVSGAAKADTCDAVKSQIEARIRGNGLVNFTLSAVDNAASAPGRVVGNCAGGARKILMTGGTPAAGGVSSGGTGAAGNIAAPAIISAAARPSAASRTRAADNILTECNDGSMSVGGSCKK